MLPLGFILVGLGLVLDCFNLLIGVRRLRGSSQSAIGGLPFVMYALGATCLQATQMRHLFAPMLIGGLAFHGLCFGVPLMLKRAQAR